MNRVREIRNRAERSRAAALVASWDYPREISHEEVIGSVWFWYGPSVLWWFSRYTDCADDELTLHVCVEPSARSRIYPRKFMAAVEVAAELMPGDFMQLRVKPLENDREGIAGYLERWGWRRDTGGWYKRLGTIPEVCDG